MTDQAPSDPFIAVIGGGPAGLMAAETLARAGRPVAIFERMPSAGRKFLLAGRGGLNLTHGEALEPFLARYRGGRPHLEAAICAFPPDAVRAWSEGLGQETFIGSSGRVFPQRMKASPLLRAWLARLGDLGVRLRSRHRWTGWEGSALAFETPDGHETMRPLATILALGGASWPSLGADGSWAPVLAASGLPVTPLMPANCGIEIDWSQPFREKSAGEPLKRIALTTGGETIRGEALVTAEGLEGGAVYALLPALRASNRIEIDLRPDMTVDEIAHRLDVPRKGQSLSTFLRKTLALAPVAIGLMREATGNALPADAADLAALVKRLTLPVKGIRPIERAISTAGGLDFSALDRHFMVTAKPGTFVAGEMLDWEAPTGGYLLQACLSTGVAAAQGMLAWMAENQTEGAERI